MEFDNITKDFTQAVGELQGKTVSAIASKESYVYDFDEELSLFSFISKPERKFIQEAIEAVYDSADDRL